MAFAPDLPQAIQIKICKLQAHHARDMTERQNLVQRLDGRAQIREEVHQQRGVCSGGQLAVISVDLLKAVRPGRRQTADRRRPRLRRMTSQRYRFRSPRRADMNHRLRPLRSIPERHFTGLLPDCGRSHQTLTGLPADINAVRPRGVNPLQKLLHSRRVERAIGVKRRYQRRKNTV